MATQNKRSFAVITGASSGIGFELARQCIGHNMDVLICAEDAGLAGAAAELGANTGVTVQAVRADLSTKDGVETLVKAVTESQRPIDALMLNAGVGVGGAFLDTSLDAELAMIALNCNHTVHVAKRLVPAMAERGQGHVLITGSVVSTAPNPYQAVYGATKAFVMSFGEALRYELAERGVTVTVMQPGATATKFFDRAGMQETPVGKADKDDPADVARRGFDAMMAGKDAVLAGGFKSRMAGFVNELLPEPMKAKSVAKTSKPPAH